MTEKYKCKLDIELWLVMGTALQREAVIYK
jgi:hypothetical protein